MRTVRLSKQDIVLLAVAALIDGPGTARMIFSLANRYLKKYFRDRSYHDFELEQFRNTLSCLRRDGLVARDGYRWWKITERGSRQADVLKKHQAYAEFKI